MGFNDKITKSFGKITKHGNTILSRTSEKFHYHYYYNVKCGLCQNIFQSYFPTQIKSCIDCRDYKSIPKASELIGVTFGRLTILKVTKKKLRDYYPIVLCQCECGKRKEIDFYNIYYGSSRSCGCQSSIRIHNHACKNKPHYDTYQCWKNMLSMLTNPKDHKFKYYGGKNITFDLRWRKFENFLEDLGEKPKKKALGRKDKNKNFNKENCYWKIWKSGKKKSKCQPLKKNKKTK